MRLGVIPTALVCSLLAVGCGASDRLGAFPADRPVTPEDVAMTIYHALGVAERKGTDREGRPFDLLPPGKPLTDLF